MYQSLLQLQYIGIIISVLALVYVYTRKAGRVQVLLLLLLHSVVINLVGYTFEMQAVDKESAITAVKFIYWGKPYIFLSTFLLVMHYCGIHMPKWLIAVLTAIHLGISLLVFTCEKNTLFYSSIDYTQEGLFPHLVLGHGVVYNIYMVIMLSFLIIMITVSGWKFTHTKIAVERKRLFGLVMMTMVYFVGIFIFMSGITGGFDTTSSAYVLSTLILIYTLVKFDLLDALVVAKDMIIDDFVDGVLVLDDKEKPIYINTQFQQICSGMGQEGEEAINRIMDLKQNSQKLETEKSIYEIHRKDIVRDEVLLGKIYLLSDVTEIYRYMVELREQKERADQANRAKSDFLAKMSHEIRTPINSILGMNEMILRESGEQNIRKYGMDVKTSANSLLSIINDILDLSKIESGKMEILPVEYELGSLLNDLVNMIFIKAREKNLKIEILVEESLPRRLYGDDVRIRQILTNLLTNAVKYTPEGTVTLEISGKVSDGQAFIHYEVRDTGIGVKEEDLPGLFVSFQRIEENRNRNIEGTGLGLSIVQQLLYKMDSSLRVESVYGKGSTFGFDLVQPVRSGECIGNFKEKVQQMEREYDYHTSFTAPKAKILVIDDNDINRSVFRNLLKKTLVQVTDADSGEKCLELVSKEHFDIIFMDHMMPEMDGIETLHRMKQQEENLCRDVPVIVLTANAVTGAREQYMEEGFYDFLSKPIVPEKMEQMIQTYLPEEYIEQETETDEKQEAGKEDSISEFEQLPDLEEFDWKYARAHFPTVQLLLETLKNIYISLEPDMKKLEKLMEDIQKPGMLDAYRIQVHTLKSTMASVGALLLSKLARLSEVAAIERNIDKLRVLHPILMEEMQKHRRRLEILVKQGDEKKEYKNASWMDIARLDELLDKLKNALEDWDYDTADALMEELVSYRHENSQLELLDTLKMQVQNIQAREAVQTIHKIRKAIDLQEDN